MNKKTKVLIIVFALLVIILLTVLITQKVVYAVVPKRDPNYLYDEDGFIRDIEAELIEELKNEQDLELRKQRADELIESNQLQYEDVYGIV